MLVVAEDSEVRAAWLRDLDRAGYEGGSGSDRAHVSRQVREMQAEALLVVAAGSTSELRLLLARARAAAEAPLPAVVLVDDGSLWLRAALPEDLGPAVALPGRPLDASRVIAAIEALVAGRSDAEDGMLGGVSFALREHRLLGPDAEADLTPSETGVLSLLAARPGAYMPVEALSQALWGAPLTDSHARGALRSHVYTLRRKLRTAGFAGVVESRTGVGYRLVIHVTDGG